MVNTALLWVGFVVACGLLCLAGTLEGYVETSAVNYWGVAGTCVATGQAVELLGANGYITKTPLVELLDLSLLLLTGLFVAIALRTSGLRWPFSDGST